MTLKVPKTVFVKTIKMLAQEDNRKSYEAAMAEVKKEIGESQPKDLTKEQILDGVKFMEAAKMGIAE